MKTEIVDSAVTSPFDLQHQQADLASKVVVALERVAEIFRVLLWQSSKKLGLSPIQIQILIFLKHHSSEKATVSYLADEFSLTKATVSDSVTTLVQKGFVERLRIAHDRRGHSLRPTARGRRALVEAEHFADPLKGIVGELSRDETDNLWRILSKIIFRSNQTGLIAIQRMCYNCDHYETRGGRSYCGLLEKDLAPSEIRVDCPDFVN